MEQLELDALKESIRYHIANCDELGDFVSTYMADAFSFIEHIAIVWEPFENISVDDLIAQIESLADQFETFAKRPRTTSPIIDTVNVVAMDGGIISSMVSYTDHNAGNCEAEKEFIRFIKENVCEDLNGESEDDILDNGYFDYGDKSVYLVHSTVGSAE